MNSTKILALTLLLIVGAFFGGTALLPNTFEVKRQMGIGGAETEDVLSMLSDFDHYNEWNPWEQKGQVSGDAHKMGHLWTWPAGHMHLNELTDKSLIASMRYSNPGAKNTLHTWAVTKTESGASVEWTVSGKLGWPGGRIWGMSADDTLGEDLQRGLSNLATYYLKNPPLGGKAQTIALETIILDGHIDLPHRLFEGKDEAGNITEDVAERTEKGDFDYPRAKEGGLDAPFMSIYVPARHDVKQSKKVADELIDIVEGIASKHADKFQIAKTPEDVRKAFADKKIAFPMGMENGAGIGKKLEHLKHFYDRGIRYITLAHSKDNHLADSSYDDKHTNQGLSKMGVKAVKEMNKLGIMVDLSHLSDQAAEKVLEVSTAPVIASHSSCRHFTPGFERNMSDEMLQKLKKNNGVIQINFGSMFLGEESQKYSEQNWETVTAQIKEKDFAKDSEEEKAFRKAFWKEHPTKKVPLSVVADHIDHVVKLIGIEHVGLGSDFDGVGDSLPIGLEDVSKFPALIEELLKRNYSREDIEKILSGNVLRVWHDVGAVASLGGMKIPEVIGELIQKEALKAGKPIIYGALDKEIIRRIVRTNSAGIKTCYEKELAKTKGLHGKITMKWVISGSGKVQQAGTADTKMNNIKVESCLARKIKSWRFPKPKGGGIVVVKYPFIFQESK